MDLFTESSSPFSGSEIVPVKHDTVIENYLLKSSERTHPRHSRAVAKRAEFTGEVLTAVDLFCGAGGTSTGLIQACEESGVGLDLVAINHWRTAIDTHLRNHRRVRHLCQSIQELNPLDVVPSGRLDLLIASPECTHFSKARGGKPRSDQSRASARLVLDWLTKLYVRYCVIENVEEMKSWSPLGSNGQPLKSKEGVLYEEFLQSLRNLGYTVETRVLNAADYGGATSRRRLIIIASRGRRRMKFPEPTHAQRAHQTQTGKSLAEWRSAAEIIDFSLKGESVFDRQKPLAGKTLYRIFAGLKKYGNLEFIEPDIMKGFSSQGNLSGGNAPAPAPYIVVLRNNSTAHSINHPLGTLCASGQHFALATPQLRSTDGTNSVKHFDDVDGKLALLHPQTLRRLNEKLYRELSDSKPQIDGDGGDAAGRTPLPNYGVKYYEGADSFPLDAPLPTITANFNHLYLAKPYVVRIGAGNSGGGKHVISSEFGEIEIIGLLDIDFRMIANPEKSLAMGFPENYIFTGTKKCVTKQIGNAVSVDLSRAIAREFIRACRKTTTSSDGGVKPKAIKPRRGGDRTNALLP